MATNESPAPKAPAAEPAKTTPKTSGPALHEPRNFLAAFLLTMVAGVLGLRHFYLGNKKLGWIRTGLFAGGYLWLIVMSIFNLPVLAMIGFFAVITASIWAVVDFFYVYNAVKTDADGQPLTATTRDRKWAKVFYLSAIIAFVVGIAVSILGATLIESELKKGNWNQSNYQNDQSQCRSGESFEQCLQRQMQEPQQTY